MTALLSILTLIGAWALLAAIERLPWPVQREEPIYDVQYWQTVKADSMAYLATHSNVSAQIREEVERTIKLAQQKLA